MAGGGEPGIGMEAERAEKKGSLGFSQFTATNLAAGTPRLLENCWQGHCQVCLEQPPRIRLADCVINVDVGEILLLDLLHANNQNRRSRG